MQPLPADPTLRQALERLSPQQWMATLRQLRLCWRITIALATVLLCLAPLIVHGHSGTAETWLALGAPLALLLWQLFGPAVRHPQPPLANTADVLAILLFCTLLLLERMAADGFPTEHLVGAANKSLMFLVAALLMTTARNRPKRGTLASRSGMLWPGLAESSVQLLPTDVVALRAALIDYGFDVVVLEAARLPDAASLAAELDRTLGAFDHPSQPWDKTLAHLGHERRGVGLRALLLLGADATERQRQPHLQDFLDAWAKGMRYNRMRRLLFVAEPVTRS